MDKKYYYSEITELVIPPTATYEDVHSAINRFIDAIPFFAEKLSDSIRHEEHNKLAETITEHLPVIKNIYAKLPEADAMLILHRIERMGHPSMLVGSFIANLMTLSIKLQKAQSYGDEMQHINTVEVHADIAHTMSLFIDFLDDNEIAGAHNILSDMNVFDEETVFVFDKLLGLLVTGDKVEARHLANDLKEKHVKIIQQSAGSSIVHKILAVDDMAESLSFISNVLKSRFKVFRVTNGKTALQVLGTQKIDLFILDIEMPEMNGYELAERIRNTYGYTETPIIFLSGNSTREHVARAIKAGANDFIIKPASYESLMTAVSKLIS